MVGGVEKKRRTRPQWGPLVVGGACVYGCDDKGVEAKYHEIIIGVRDGEIQAYATLEFVDFVYCAVTKRSVSCKDGRGRK